MIIDYSAHDKFVFCPAAWYERYINKLQVRWQTAQRDDALALGTLVHEGLRVWQLNHVVDIPAEIVDEVNPTKDCYNLALELVYGYARAYPEEVWPLIFCEEPLTFPLTKTSYEARMEWKEDLTGLAKIDSYFYVPEVTTINGGLDGMSLTLNPGWWIHEYKTKSPDIPIGLYMQSWEMNLQASYQMMALKAHVAKMDRSCNYVWEVQGALVNVLEKPKRYTPRRKCLTCAEYYDYAAWIPTGTGEYACPVCGSRQKLTAAKEATPSRPPAYYRILVTRNERELAFDREQIVKTGLRMMEMEREGLESEAWHKRNCVTFFPKRTCEYFGPHKNLVPTIEYPEFEPVKDYRGLVVV